MDSGDRARSCPFCEIVAGRLPSSEVYADADVVAFLDVRPVTTGHLLVIPRAHASDLEALDPHACARMFVAARALAAALRTSGLRCEGVNLYLADGVAAGQEVFHVHLHVLPRFQGDGFALHAQFQHPDRADLDATAAMIRGRVDITG